MRLVASHAAFRLHRSMLESEWPGLIGMAAEAQHVLGSGGTQLMGKKTTMRVVTVGAADQPFIHAMVEGLGEIGLNFEMAGVAELGLRRPQQLAVDFGVMNGMAVDTANVVLQMLGTQEVGVFLTELVAAQAALG